VPYDKSTTVLLRDDRFDATDAIKSLVQIPTMASGLMQANIEVLDEAGLLPSPVKKARAPASPEEIGEAARALARQALSAEPAITAQLDGIVQSVGGSLQGRSETLVSVQSLRERLDSAMKFKGLSLDAAKDGLTDAVRYSVVLPSDSFAQGCRAVMAQLDAHDCRKTKVTNHFIHGANDFAGISVVFSHPNGQRFQIQFHTDATFALKQQFHDLYKQSFQLSAQGASRAELRTLMAPVRTAFRNVPLPAGCDEIENWERVGRSNTTGASARPSTDQQRVAPQVALLTRKARNLEAFATPRLKAAVNRAGARLSGTDKPNWEKHIYKSDKSLARKILLVQRQQSLNADEAARQVRDALRYVVVATKDSFAAQVSAVLADLKAAGLTVTTVNNGFITENTSYAGLNVKVSRDEDEFEIQFHTDASLQNK